MTMIPTGIGQNAKAEAGEINSLEQQAQQTFGSAPKGHQNRTTPHRDGMAYGERGDQNSQKAQPMKQKATVLKGILDEAQMTQPQTTQDPPERSTGPPGTQGRAAPAQAGRADPAVQAGLRQPRADRQPARGRAEYRHAPRRAEPRAARQPWAHRRPRPGHGPSRRSPSPRRADRPRQGQDSRALDQGRPADAQSQGGA